MLRRQKLKEKLKKRKENVCKVNVKTKVRKEKEEREGRVVFRGHMFHICIANDPKWSSTRGRSCNIVLYR